MNLGPPSPYRGNPVYSNNRLTIDDMNTANTEYIQNADRAIQSMLFENTVGRVNKCVQTGGGQFEHYL
jgi:hypothetical protein